MFAVDGSSPLPQIPPGHVVTFLGAVDDVASAVRKALGCASGGADGIASASRGGAVPEGDDSAATHFYIGEALGADIENDDSAPGCADVFDKPLGAVLEHCNSAPCCAEVFDEPLSPLSLKDARCQ